MNIYIYLYAYIYLIHNINIYSVEGKRTPYLKCIYIYIFEMNKKHDIY
jgi:hypothetical protein